MSKIVKDSVMATIANCKDLLMLLLYARGHSGELCEPVFGKTRLMKMVFLFDKEIRREFNLGKAVPQSAMPEFKPYDYGPFSAQVYGDLEFLVEMGFVEASPVDEEEKLDEEVKEYEYWRAVADGDDDEVGSAQEKFRLTDVGREFVEKRLLEGLTEDQFKALDQFKHRCTAANLRSLLKYVYTKYPDMTTSSKIRDKVVGT